MVVAVDLTGAGDGKRFGGPLEPVALAEVARDRGPGTEMSQTCSACKTVLPTEARFCSNCGVAIVPPAEPPDALGTRTYSQNAGIVAVVFGIAAALAPFVLGKTQFWFAFVAVGIAFVVVGLREALG